MSLGNRIKAARKRRGLSQLDVATTLGLTTQAISQWENDKTVPTHDNLVALTETLGEDLIGDSAGERGGELMPVDARLSPVVIAGRTAAGVFREVDEFDQSETERVWLPIDERFPRARRMMFDVEGASMNALKPRPILEGDRVVCVSFEDIADELKMRTGLVVVVERSRDGGQTREWTVKQLEVYADRIELHPRSTDARFKPIVINRDAGADDGTQVEIIGLVRSIDSPLPI